MTPEEINELALLADELDHRGDRMDATIVRKAVARLRELEAERERWVTPFKVIEFPQSDPAMREYAQKALREMKEPVTIPMPTESDTDFRKRTGVFLPELFTPVIVVKDGGLVDGGKK